MTRSETSNPNRFTPNQFLEYMLDACSDEYKCIFFGNLCEQAEVARKEQNVDAILAEDATIMAGNGSGSVEPWSVNIKVIFLDLESVIPIVNAAKLGDLRVSPGFWHSGNIVLNGGVGFIGGDIRFLTYEEDDWVVLDIGKQKFDRIFIPPQTPDVVSVN